LNLQHYYWYYTAALPPKLCDDIMDYAQRLKSVKAEIGAHDKARKENKELTEEEKLNVQKKRNSDLVWLDEQWIYKEIHPYVHEANEKAGWNFDWDWSESCQFTKYDVGQYYGWHCDSWDKPYGEEKGENYVGKIRKLSVTVSLSEPTDYEGGNLEFDFRNSMDLEWEKGVAQKECVEIRPRGSIIVFPSFVWHRVKPVTKGTRHSLVMWNCGYPWR